MRSPPSFLVDGMLGTIARKLRVLGYDAIYDPKLDDAELLHLTHESGRVLLTNDTALYIRAKSSGLLVVLVSGLSEEERLYQILLKTGISHIFPDNLDSRCSVCNATLAKTGMINQNSSEIYSCASCGKKYWRGSHWKKMLPLFDQVNSMLAKSVERETIGA